MASGANRARDLPESTAASGRRRFRVLAEGLQYPTDPAIIRRLAAGENIPHESRGPMRDPTPGAIVDDIPSASIASCLAQGWIEDADKPAAVSMTFTEAADDDDEGEGDT